VSGDVGKLVADDRRIRRVVDHDGVVEGVAEVERDALRERERPHHLDALRPGRADVLGLHDEDGRRGEGLPAMMLSIVL